MNYIAATLSEAQHKNCVGLYVGKQKLNGRLRIPDAALTLFAKTDTHTNTYTLMPHCLLKLSTGHRVDQKEERSAGCLNMNMNQGGGEEEANNIPDIGQ